MEGSPAFLLPSAFCLLTRCRLLLLVFGERLAQLLNCDLFLCGCEDDLARQHHRHRPGGGAEEVIDRHAKA